MRCLGRGRVTATRKLSEEACARHGSSLTAYCLPDVACPLLLAINRLTRSTGSASLLPHERVIRSRLRSPSLSNGNLPGNLAGQRIKRTLACIARGYEGAKEGGRRSDLQSGHGGLMPLILMYAIIWPMCSCVCAKSRRYTRRTVVCSPKKCRS
jgi:hypothetical protein